MRTLCLRHNTCTEGGTCLGSRHFVNKVSGQHFLAENKQEAAEFYSQHLPVHSRGVIWKIKSKSNFPVSFSLIGAEMNLVGNYRTLRGLRTVNPEGLPSVHEKLKIIGHIGHFRWLGPNISWEISQIWIEYIKPIGQMSDESWKFFRYTGCRQLMSVYKTSGRPFANATCQLYGRLLNGGDWSVLATAKEPLTTCLTRYIWRYLMQQYWTTMIPWGHTNFLWLKF